MLIPRVNNHLENGEPFKQSTKYYLYGSDVEVMIMEKEKKRYVP
jgi:hypothetical protein